MKPPLTKKQIMLKSLIVDDEESARETLRVFLEEYCPTVEIIGMAENVDEAYRQIIMKKPSLVFLDVSMPPSDGFELLRRFKSLPFEFIFTTAYNQFAIQAIRFSASDYLLKPIDPMELLAAVQRVIEKAGKLNEANVTQSKLVLLSEKSYFFVEPDKIVHIEFEGRKIVIHLLDQNKYEVSKSIQEMEELLDNNFFRCHRSFIINLKEIKEYVPDKHGGCVIMNNNKVVPVAERRKEEFLKIFSRGRI
jgi:two-component system, LytTR family, response regulator